MMEKWTAKWSISVPKIAALTLSFCLLLSGTSRAGGPPPVITVQPLSQSVLVSNSVTFLVVASSGTTLSYQWRKNGANISGATLSSYTISSVRQSDAADYSVRVVNGGGTLYSSNATLTVLVPAGITTQPQSQAVVQNQNASFSVVASGTAPFSYQWNLDGIPLLGATNPLLALSNVQTSDAGNYTVVVVNAYGTVTSAVAILTVLVPPVITTQPQSQTVIQGQTGSFSVVATGTPLPSYQWRYYGFNLSGATNSTLTGSNVQTSSAGNYSVVVANAAGSVTSAVVTLTVLVPAGITTQPQSMTVIQNENTSFSVVPSGTAPFSYQWNFNGTALSAATNASLALTNVQTTDAGGYTVVVTNSSGSVTSAVATLTVYVPPSITTQPQSQAVILGDTVSFSVETSGSSPFTYQWYLNGSATGAGAGKLQTFILSNVATNKAGNYIVVVTGPGGSVTSIVATLTVYVPVSILTQPQSQTVVKGTNASFTVVANGSAPFSYQWNLNGAMISDATNASLTLPNVQTSSAGNYTVVVTNIAGSVTSIVATLTVNVPAGILTQPQSQTVVQNQSVSFYVDASGTAPLRYQWRFNNTNLTAATNATLTLTNVQTAKAGSYTVVVTNVAGSVTSAVATLIVLVPAGITTQPQSRTVNQNQNTSFSVVASGTAPFSYQWVFNGTPLSGATNAALALANVQPANAGSYTVIVTNLANSVTSSAATLTVYVPPTIVTEPASQAVMVGQDAAFTVVPSGTAPFSYQWRFNGAALAGATNASCALTNVQRGVAGNYSVVVINPVGSTNSIEATLSVSIPPTTLSVSGPSALSPSGFTFQLSVPIGYTYVIEASTNLRDWLPIATNISNTATVVFTDAAARNYSERFYRALVR